MRRAKRIILIMIPFCFLFLGTLATKAKAYYTNMPASVVLGQTDFTTASCGTSRDKFGNGDKTPVVDSRNRLIYPDTSNNRVLIWNSLPTTSGVLPDLVLGQADFDSVSANRGGTANSNTLNSPFGAYSDGTKLFVTDGLNRRVLIWNTFPTTNGQAADVVVGQANMTASSQNGCISTSFGETPYSVFVYNGKLLVSASTNTSIANRVLVWNTIPTTNGVAADVVVGQPDMTTCTAGTTQSKISSPRQIFVDGSGKLYVADRTNQRILIFNSIPTTNGASADVVVGQTDFNTATSAVTNDKLTNPHGVVVANGKLFIADSTSNRLLVWNSVPTSNGIGADMVLGQSDFISSSVNGGAAGVTPSGFNGARFFAINNKIIFSDSLNCRILIFDNVNATPGIGVSSITESAGNGRLRVRGNLRIGELNHYSARLRVSVNGDTLNNVSSLYNQHEDNHDNLYEFYHEFNPASNRYPTDPGYTLNFLGTSSNGEESNALYFTPFELNSVSSDKFPTVTFQVNKYQFPRIADSLAEYEVQVKKDGTSSWETYIDNIPTSAATANNALTTSYDYVNGIITIRSKVKQLGSGKYQVKVVAVSRGGSRQDSPIKTLSTTGGVSSSVVRPTLQVDSGFFPLQINKISGVFTNIISSFAGGVSSLFSTTTHPIFSGIAFSGSQINLVVSNKLAPSQQKSFITTSGANSTFSISPVLFPQSIIDMWVVNGSHYNELPPFEIKIN